MADTRPAQIAESVAYPIYKFGARWICDGPDGRFHAKTKSEAETLLAASLERRHSDGEVC